MFFHIYSPYQVLKCISSLIRIKDFKELAFDLFLIKTRIKNKKKLQQTFYIFE